MGNRPSRNDSRAEGSRSFDLRDGNHSIEAWEPPPSRPSPHHPGHHGPSLRPKPRLLAHLPPWLWPSHSLPPGRADLQGGPAVATRAACQPPRRPGQPSAVPSARPPGSDKAPDEIIALGPQGGPRLCSSTSFPAQKPGTVGAVAGAGGPETPSLHRQGL